jgi:hypothetical protein
MNIKDRTIIRKTPTVAVTPRQELTNGTEEETVVMTKKQMLAKLPPSILAQLPPFRMEQSVSQVSPEFVDGTVFEIAPLADPQKARNMKRAEDHGFLFLRKGASVRENVSDDAWGYELVKGKLAFKGKSGRALKFEANMPHGIDKVPFDTVVKFSKLKTEPNFEVKPFGEPLGQI